MERKYPNLCKTITLGRTTFRNRMFSAPMGSGLSIDPTDRFSDIGTTASNANIEAAIETVFGKNSPTGTLPVNIPKVGEDNNGKLYYEKDYLYNRGFGLNYSR